MILILFLGGLASQTSRADQPDRSNWPVREIRLSPQGTLKDLFDSGLRPFRFPSLERHSLEVKHVRSIVVQPNGFKLPQFEAEIIDITVLANGLLSAIEFYNQTRTIEEARREMLRWMHLGNMPKRTEADLDAFLKAVANDYMNYDDLGKGMTHNFVIRWQDENKIDYNVWFQKGRNPAKPLCVSMKIGFPRTPREASSHYSEPVPPPPGYEDADMTAPKDFGPDSPPRDPEVERVIKEGVMPDYTDLPKKRIRSKILPPGHHPVPEEVPLGASWWPWAVGGVFVVVTLFLLLKKRFS